MVRACCMRALTSTVCVSVRVCVCGACTHLYYVCFSKGLYVVRACCMRALISTVCVSVRVCVCGACVLYACTHLYCVCFSKGLCMWCMRAVCVHSPPLCVFQ